MRQDGVDDRALDRADIGDDRALLQRRRDLGRDRPAGADRHAEDDVVGIDSRFRRRLRDRIAKAQLSRPLADGFVAIRQHDRAG